MRRRWTVSAISFWRSSAICLMLVLRAATVAAGPKTDVIVLTKGDRLTAEIKKLARGRMTVKTDSLGTASVHWADVVSITSTKTFELEDVAGRRFYGSLTVGAPKFLVVVGPGISQTLALLDVIRLSPIEASFWSRLDGSVDVGFNFTQASQQTQWALNANAEFGRPAFVNRAQLSSQLTALQDNSQSRNSLSLSSERFLKQRWFTGGLGQFQQDESLGLDFRSVLGGAFGRYLKQTSHTNLAAFGGLAYTREHFTGDSAENSAEAVLGTDWEWFSPGDTDTDMSTTVVSYYSLTGQARARVELNTSLKREMFKDFYWSINAFDSRFNAVSKSAESA